MAYILHDLGFKVAWPILMCGLNHVQSQRALSTMNMCLSIWIYPMR